MLNEYLAATNSRYRRAEVIKAGIYAYENCQELRLFESRVQKYRPDVVFVIYTNELRDNETFCRLEGDTLWLERENPHKDKPETAFAPTLQDTFDSGGFTIQVSRDGNGDPAGIRLGVGRVRNIECVPTQ